VTKYTQKSWNHTVSSGSLTEAELALRWEMVFGKKKRESGSSDGADAKASEKTSARKISARKKRAS
jgi:hypothetical protein